jgi:translocation and assembly module TamB
VKYRKLLATCVILAAVLGVIGWLIGTTSGLRFIVARALPHLPVTLDTAQLDGRLVGPLSTGRIELTAPGVRGTIERIELDWRPAALASRTLHIRALRIEAPRFELESQPGADDAATGETGPLSLPLDVILERLELRDGELRSDGRLLVAELQLELAGSAAGDRLELARLALDSSQGELSGHAHASLSRGEPWDVDLAWRMHLADGPVAGHTQITGSLAELQVAQSFSGLIEGGITGTLSGLPTHPAWQLELALAPLPSRAGAGPWPEALDGMAARLGIDGRLEDSTLAGEVALPGIVPGRIDVALEGGWEDGVADIRRLDLRLADGGRLGGSGRVTPDDDFAAEFALDGTGLGWPLGQAEQAVELPRLSLRGSGAGDRWRVTVDGLARHGELPEAAFTGALEWAATTLTLERLDIASPGDELRATASGVLETAGGQLDYRVVAETDVRLPEYPPVSARLTAAGDAHGVNIETLAAQLLDGSLEGAGRITWAGEDAADFRLSFADLDPAGLAAGWPGRLSGTLELSGLPANADGLEIVLSSLAGELRSLPVDGAAALNISGDTLHLRSASLAIGANSLEASGRLDDETVMLDARLEAPSLDVLADAARGSLAASARVRGTRVAPQIVLEASGARLGWQGMRARALRIDADVDLSGTQVSRLVAELEGFATAPGPGATLRLEAGGTPADHRLLVALDRARPEQGLRLGLEGAMTDGRWTGRLAELTLAQAQQTIWALQRPAALSASAAQLTLDDACMQGTLGLLCLQAAWQRAGPWSGRATLNELDLAPLSEWLQSGLLARGILTGQIVVEADDDVFRALSGGLELTAGDIRVATEDSEPLLAWTGATAAMTGDETEARATLRLVLADGNVLEGGVSVGWNAPDPPLQGKLEAALEQLQLISELLPELADLEGRASLQLTLAGTLSEPQLGGRFELLDGTTQIPILGLRPEGINFVAELEAGALSFQASGRSGDGNFEADGSFDLRAESVEGRATLRGENLLLSNLTDIRIAASPDLRFHYSDNDLVIGGEVGIPYGRISGIGSPTAVTVSPDEVIVGPRASSAEDELSVRSRIRIEVGPDVQVQAVGLRGRIEGNILTVTEPQALPWGRGELRVVDGTFSVFGQGLEIETGRLIYTGGPLENPGLEIRAVRRVDQVTAGALVRGTLQEPEISVYSDPPMPRAEALSYLMLGKSLDELQSGEQTTLNQAANSLALSGGGVIASDLGRRLGFDDVSVTADDDTGGASVVIGKSLGSGLYVSYGLGLFDTINTLRLRFQVNKRLSLEATSGAEAAADIFYTFERD